MAGNKKGNYSKKRELKISMSFPWKVPCNFYVASEFYRQKISIIFLDFPRKYGLAIHMNCLLKKTEEICCKMLSANILVQDANF